MFENLNEVHTWLEDESNDSRFYMKLLSLNWRINPQTEQHYLSALNKLAEELLIYPVIVCDLIRHPDWRINLIGNAIAILQQKSEFETDLAERLLGNYAWVAPQLAAGFALLTSGKCVSQLENYLRKVDDASEIDTKAVLSVYAGLSLIDNDTAQEFATKPIFAKLHSQDRHRCVRRTQNYYTYWKNLQSV